MLTYYEFFNAVRNHSSIGIPHFHSDLKVEESLVYIPALKDLKHDIGNMLNKAIAAVEEENDALGS